MDINRVISADGAEIYWETANQRCGDQHVLVVGGPTCLHPASSLLQHLCSFLYMHRSGSWRRLETLRQGIKDCVKSPNAPSTSSAQFVHAKGTGLSRPGFFVGVYGTLRQLGIVVGSGLDLCLSLSYLMMLQYGWKEPQLRKYLEYPSYATVFPVGFVMTFYPLLTDGFVPNATGNGCSVPSDRNESSHDKFLSWISHGTTFMSLGHLVMSCYM